MTATTEFNYLITEAEHVDGSNRYTFQYPAYWRQSIYNGLKVGIRSIKLTTAPMYFQLTSINICSKSGDIIDMKPIDFFIPISSSDCLDNLNVRFKEAVAKALEPYKFIGPADIALEYNNNCLYLYINRADDAIWFNIDDMDANEDTKRMLHFDTVDDIPKENLKYDIKVGPLPEGQEPYEHLVQIKFPNVWDRDDLYVLSSLTDMSYNRYIGYTNNDFYPPKQYSIHNNDTTFWIDLYDKTNTIPVELPPHSVLVIEMVLAQQGLK